MQLAIPNQSLLQLEELVQWLHTQNDWLIGYQAIFEAMNKALEYRGLKNSKIPMTNIWQNFFHDPQSYQN